MTLTLLGGHHFSVFFSARRDPSQSKVDSQMGQAARTVLDRRMCCWLGKARLGKLESPHCRHRYGFHHILQNSNVLNYNPKKMPVCFSFYHLHWGFAIPYFMTFFACGNDVAYMHVQKHQVQVTRVWTFHVDLHLHEGH